MVGQISMDLVDQESNRRGYLITGKSEFLNPYQEAKEQITTRITALKKVVNNSLNKQLVFAKIDKVQSLSTLWHTEAAAPEIEARREINKTGLSTLKFLEGVLNRNTGKAILDQQLSPVKKQVALQLVKALKDQVSPLVVKAEAHAQQQVSAILDKALTEMKTKLEQELQRLTALKAINPSVRQEEIDFIKVQQQELSDYINKAQLKFEAVRMIVVSN